MPEQNGRAERKADHDHKFDEQAGISDGVQHGKPMRAVMLAGRPDWGGGPWLGSACVRHNCGRRGLARHESPYQVRCGAANGGRLSGARGFQPNFAPAAISLILRNIP